MPRPTQHALLTRTPRRGFRAAGLLAALVVMGLSGAATAAPLTATNTGSGAANWSNNKLWIWSGTGTCTYNGTNGTKCVPGVDAAAAGATVVIGATVSVDTSVG